MTNHYFFLERSLAIAKQSLDNGNLPFGCLLAGPDNNILAEAENTVLTDDDMIAHCEINLIHMLSGKYEADFLQNCTVYASTEPCPMCAAAIFWSGIGNIVFALPKETFHQVAKTNNPSHVFDIKASELLSHGGRKVTVTGPVMEKQAALFYKALLKEQG